MAYRAGWLTWARNNDHWFIVGGGLLAFGLFNQKIVDAITVPVSELVCRNHFLLSFFSFLSDLLPFFLPSCIFHLLVPFAFPSLPPSLVNPDIDSAMQIQPRGHPLAIRTSNEIAYQAAQSVFLPKIYGLEAQLRHHQNANKPINDKYREVEQEVAQLKARLASFPKY
jgi:hypothetical protein